MDKIMRIAQKEFQSFFASPAAFLFLGAFLAATLFIVFWVETFFARNIADLRPMFQWMPLLLIFLVAALTMRSWSEERRSGTLETLLTSPVNPLHLIAGKFAAALALVVVGLALTLPLTLTVALLGPLDWGPVLGGYIATLFLAAAYVSIGLFMSARTDNPIVALILTTAVCGLFYFIGSPTLTNLFGHEVSHFLALLGSGSRFDAITRGVVDLRDLYYYLSLVGVFLTLNLFTLERLKWAGNPISQRHKQWGWLTALLVANFVAGNLWLGSIGWLRQDMTAGKLYSLSEATQQQLQQLQEPLQIRGYFSAKTHPLLAPLVPQIRDLLKEYAQLSKGRVEVAFIDPQRSPALEEEAASRYGIRPVPFQMASRHQASVVNAYFDLVVAYGDQFQKLSYTDLIEIKSGASRELEVMLKNPEYAITQSIRKVQHAYQSGGNPFEGLAHPVTFTGYLSQPLPAGVEKLQGALQSALDELTAQGKEKFKVQFKDPGQDPALAKQLKQDYGFKPQIASLLDPQPFWFYMVLTGNDSDGIPVPLPEELTKEGLKRTIEAAVQRMAPGFLKNITLTTATPAPAGMMGRAPTPGKGYTLLQEALGESLKVTSNDLQSGQVPAQTDLLMVMGPDKLNEKQLFAMDQFLMQGGTVVLATSPFDVDLQGSLSVANKHDAGLTEWLASHGITLQEKMVLDAQKASLPVPVTRYIGPMAVEEIQQFPYPHFPDLRGASLNPKSPITAGLGQLTINWASPIVVDAEPNKTRQVIPLLHSSKQSWSSDALNILPDYQAYPDQGFPKPDSQEPQLLAVALEGRFDSFFKDKASPLLHEQEAPSAHAPEEKAQQTDPEPTKPQFGGVLEHSSPEARLILIASNGFASDEVLSLASQGAGTLYNKPIELLQNSIDWALQDAALMQIRGRMQFARTLLPMSDGSRMVIEYFNYGLVLLGLLGIWLWRRAVRLRQLRRHQAILAEV
ncbi:ABC transporter, inner membrane protein [Magnetococcus marinus MC-1]|uniref:ABC transporter, inner membrane protein n=1 Tax=Magnetococcus marinus (strain ATCC BAA-1437 / JCM 17883 / MC-1) TaxID=156889 RepID=A0L4K8_MAGMM|nr:Gldg family protein [Magnetococcus marinus]ABK42901.1 ABC transporter, inner membrane protein [Magnetococcus marinus MC-1]